MTPIRLLYKFIRYWRCFSLLLIASFLSLFLIYASQNDPKMEYFGLGVKYFKNLVDIKPEDVKKLIETNKLDYEFLKTNARFCFNSDLKETNEPSNLDILNDYDHDQAEASNSRRIEIIILSISQAVNVKHRSAARQTWSKNLKELNAKLVFVIGNPFYEAENKTTSSSSEPLAQFDLKDQAKLEREVNTHHDIIQINMPDQESYRSTKVLISIRWSFTYCFNAKYIFVMSDTAVLNMEKFAKLVKEKYRLEQSLNNSVGGFCDLMDEKFASALKIFYMHLFNKQKNTITTQTVKPQILNNKSNVLDEKRELAFSNYNGEYCSNLGEF